MYTASLPLAPALEALRGGQQALDSSLDEAWKRVEEGEPHIEALLPETNRRERLLQESTALRERFPEANQRPPLYGALLGIKDLFILDGFATHAGSQLPTELFVGPEASCI
ncbi:MAG TPA: amidase, partial [Ktedonobacteraceae bacterium]|nr:amidase [Ktedonobacteraceae bacterium]